MQRTEPGEGGGGVGLNALIYDHGGNEFTILQGELIICVQQISYTMSLAVSAGEENALCEAVEI